MADMKTWYPWGQKKKERNERSKEKEERKRGGKGKRKEGNGRETRRDGLVGVMWGTRCKFATLGQSKNPLPRTHPGLRTH